MIKISSILNEVNNSLMTHYFENITTYNVSKIINKDEISFPGVYVGAGNYQSIIEDSKGLIIYPRILDFENDEDLELGFGRNSLTTETYQIRYVFFGNQIEIERSCQDINYYLAKEFKKLFPRTLDLADTNIIKVTGIEYDKETVKETEFVDYTPESVLFYIDIEVMIKGLEECNSLTCEGGFYSRDAIIGSCKIA